MQEIRNQISSSWISKLSQIMKRGASIIKLIQLIYYSKSTSPLEEKNAVLKSIVSAGQKTNPGLGISGLLLFSNEFYLQALEGPRRHVNDLYFRIQKDPRHSDSQLILYRDIHRRDFADWSMAWANEADRKKDAYFKYCGTPDLFQQI